MERSQLKPTVSFGPNALATLGGLAGRRVTVTTGSFLAWSGPLERVCARLWDYIVEAFDQVMLDPSLELVAQGVRVLAEFHPQAVVAFDGGSPMDRAKAMLEFDRKLRTGADIRFVAMPTTAGTGSEVTSFTVLIDRAERVKYPLVDDALPPDEVVLGPFLLAGVFPTVTADTGMDVFTHAAGAYVAYGITPYTDALAEEASTLAQQNLRPAQETAGESGARGDMLLASNLAGIAFSTAGLGTRHSLAYALDGWLHLPHGWLDTPILLHTIHFNATDGTAAGKYGCLTRLYGLAANPRSLAVGLNRLCAQPKLPEYLSICEVEGKESTITLNGLVEATQVDFCASSNPRPAAAEDLKSLLRESA